MKQRTLILSVSALVFAATALLLCSASEPRQLFAELPARLQEPLDREYRELEKLIQSAHDSAPPEIATASDDERAALAAPASEPDAEQLREWQELPRLKNDVVRWLSGCYATVTRDKLLRHPELNPADRFVPRSHRESLDLLLAHYQPMLKQARDLQGAIGLKALLAAARAGTLQPTEGEPADPRIDRDAIKLSSGGKTYYRNRRDVPEITGVLTFKRIYRAEFIDSIVQWFAVHGYCPTDAADHHRARCSALLAKWIAKDKPDRR